MHHCQRKLDDHQERWIVVTPTFLGNPPSPVHFPFTDATYGIVNIATDNLGSQTSNANLNCTVQTPDLAGNGGPDGLVKINGGASYTTTTIVTLDLSKIQSGNPTQMQISNDALTWSAKMATTPLTSWTLTAGDGQKWVYARFYDSSGKYGPAAWTSITMDTGPPGPPTTLKLLSSTTSGANKTVTLGWTAPVPLPSDIGGYRLYSRLITSSGAYGLVCTTASTSCTTTYKKTDSYQFYVVAYDLAGNVMSDVGRRGDAQFGDARSDVDDHGEHALHNKSRAVVDHGHRRFLARQRGDRGAKRFGAGQRRFHQRAPARKAPNMSTATVRAGSRSSRTAALEASSPSGVTKHGPLDGGLPPSAILTPASFSQLRQLAAAIFIGDPGRLRLRLRRYRNGRRARRPPACHSRRSPAPVLRPSNPPATRTAIFAEG